MNTINTTIPAIKIEANNDGTLTLEQDWLGNVDRVAIHPVHVRYLAEHLAMVREGSASDAELLRTERGQVASLRQENDRLKRNMLRLREHALALQEDFRENADFDHADLTHEMNTINALVNLFDMAVDDFADDYTANVPSENPQVTQAEPSGFAPKPLATPPIPDGFQTPPELGVLSASAAAGARSAGGAPSAPPQDLHPRSKSAAQQLQLEG